MTRKTNKVTDGRERATVSKMKDLMMKKIRKTTSSQVAPRIKSMVVNSSRTASDDQ